MAADSLWKFDDFFKLSSAEEHALKRQLAVKLHVRYTDKINGETPFAHSVNGIAPYDPEAMQAWCEELDALKAKSAESEEAARNNQSKLNELTCKSVVVNGCQIAWENGLRPNVGYITAWAQANLGGWDSGIERKAGGIVREVSWGCQRLVATNTSSLWALIATVVYQFKTQSSIDEKLADAFVRIRLLVYPHATADELLVLPSS